MAHHCCISQECGANVSISITPAPPRPGPAPKLCTGVLSRALYNFGAVLALGPSFLPQILSAAAHTGKVTLPGSAAHPLPLLCSSPEPPAQLLPLPVTDLLSVLDSPRSRGGGTIPPGLQGNTQMFSQLTNIIFPLLC